MKRYGNSLRFDAKKHREQEWKREHDAGGFRCSHCKKFVIINDIMGTANRNHCNWCFWSKHVDESKGDRRATCGDGMRPIGLTFKREGYDRIGEVMFIHLCLGCQKISINRIARDDPEDQILNIFQQSLKLNGTLKSRIVNEDIYLLSEADEQELSVQLFGNVQGNKNGN